MSKVSKGNKVKVHYTGRLTDGSEFDSSRESEPLEVTIGSGGLIVGFENGLLEMAVGESKTVTIEPDEGYGTKQDDLVIEVPLEDFPADIKPEVGLELTVQSEEGPQMNALVVAMDDETVTVDANHPLAGETLVFDLEIVEIS